MTINTYINAHDFRAAPTGQELASIMGNLAKISTSVNAGFVSLPISPAATAQINLYDNIYIFDGANTEIVQCTQAVALGALTIQTTPLVYNHAQMTSCCTDGPQGASLGQVILNASSELENIAKQSLLQATYTENLNLPGRRANIDLDAALNVRPLHTPLVSLASATLITDITTDGINVSQTQLSGSIFSIQNAGIAVPQYTEGLVTITYTAGFLYSALPYDIKQAAIWLVCELLSDRDNPTGAAMISQGKSRLQQRLVHETDSIYHLRAVSYITKYMAKAY